MSRTAAAVVLMLVLARPSAASAAEIVERIVAVVNDEILLLSELRDRMLPFIARVRALPTPEERQAGLLQVEREVLQAMVDEILITQQARRSNVTVSGEEVERAIQNVMRANQMSREDFMRALASQGMSFPQYQIDVRRQLLALKVLNARVRGRINITNEDVRDAYNQTVRQVRMADPFEGAQIFVAVPPTSGPREVAAARARAEQALARVKRGDSFEDVARAMSQDGASRANGGRLGSLRHGQLDPALDDVFLNLEPGEVAPDLVRTRLGFHVVKLVAREASPVRSFEEVRPSLEAQLLEREMGRQQNLWLKELRRRAFLQVRLRPAAPARP